MILGHWKGFAKLVSSIVLLAILFAFVDWREGLSLLLAVDLKPLAFVFVLYVVGLWLSSVKWRMLLVIQNVSTTVGQLFRLYWTGAFIGNFLPSTVGGDFSRLAFLRSTNRLAEVAASIVLERVTGLVVLLVFSIFSLSLRPQYFGDSFLLPVLWLIVCAVLGVVFVVYAFSAYIVAWLGRLNLNEKWLLYKVVVKARKVMFAILFFREQALVLFNCMALSCVFYLLSFVAQYLIFYSLGLHVPVVEIMFILPIISLISLIPISLNSFGLTESVFVLFFVRAGLESSEALAAALLGRALMILFSSLGGIWWFIERQKLKIMQRSSDGNNVGN